MPLVQTTSSALAGATSADWGPAPQFLCMGAQKAGDPVAVRPSRQSSADLDPPLKELRFFGGRWSHTRAKALARFNYRISDSWRGEDVDIRDVEFLRRIWFETTDADASDPEVYRRLFSVAAGAVTGDISPQYARLGTAGIGTVVDQLPGTRFVYLVREPVARLWSQVTMEVRWGKYPHAVAEDPAALADFIRIPGVVTHSFQSRVIKRWDALVGERFAAFLMDDMIAVPTEFRKEIFAHIGVDGDLCRIRADHNKKDGQRKLELTPPLREVLEDYLGAERTELKRLVAAGTLRALPQNTAGVGWLA